MASAQPVLNLTFHGLGEPGRELEPGEEKVWLDRDRLIEILDAVRDRTDLCITFDDGNLSDFEIGLPALIQRRMKASFFVVAGRVGKPHFLDRSHLTALLDARMEIGSHGQSHLPWPSLDDRNLTDELYGAKKNLEDLLGRPVNQAACPFGSYGRRVLSGLRSAGYTTVYTSDRGWAWRDDWLQARNTLHRGDGPEILAALDQSRTRGGLSGWGRNVRLALKRWR